MKHALRWLLSLLVFWVAFSPGNAHSQIKPGTEDPFPLLPGLESPVEFWKKIFTEYSISQLVFFDPLDMSRIYDVLDVGEESRPAEYINSERERIAAAHGVDLERVRPQRGIKERTAAGLKRSGRYIAQMQQIFRDRGLPVELTYLPIVESSYDINARSSAGALGMWQFMRATGRHYMRVDRSIDERRDPLESTRAAASFLKQSYETLGNWPLAITAYNYGPGGMARAVKEMESDNLVELIRDYRHPYWGFPPKNFYAEFLAAVEIGKNVNQYFPELELDPPLAIQEIELKNSSSLVVLAKNTGLTRDQLLAWNPALTAQIRSVPAGYRVKVPVDSNARPVIEVAQVREVARSQPREQPQVVRHQVKRGETLFQIARRYGASVDRILKMNGMGKGHRLQAGTTLVVPRL
ncbi:MAG TPA: transglycosylase SLT domain-containing protein [Candidatus Binatia bacterium]|nr:transglycosylase SLT domain-containing protein [Candidatus Binatia bacterium]